MISSYTFLIFVYFVQFCSSARILGIFLVPSYSHQIVFQPIYKELSLRGHEVIVLTPNPLKDQTLTNLTEIDFSDTYKYIKDVFKLDPNNYITMRTIADELSNKILVDILEDERFKKIYEDPNQKFDLVLIEGFSSFVQVFGYKFNAPEIPVFSMEALFETHSIIGNTLHPAIYGAAFLEYEHPISIWQKLRNTYYFLWTKLKYMCVFRPKADAIVKKYFGKDFPPISSLEKNLSVVFVNKNKFMSSVRPTPPGLIQFEFMHVKPPKPLPKDIEEILNNAKQGVVYFSLGSNIKSAGLPPSTINAIVSGLSELPYTVLWKWESDKVPGVGRNVVTRKWLPQQDILAHPNVKVFVTQGGLQSIEEAIFRVVPLVGIPIIGDQVSNVNRLVKLGIAEHLPLEEITKESLAAAVIKVAEKPMYRQNLEKIREISLDQTMTGLEKAIWWSEYVIRHKGAPHLRSASADVSFYEYLMIDVIATVFVILFISVVVLVKLIKLCYNKFGKCNTSGNKQKKLS